MEGGVFEKKKNFFQFLLEGLLDWLGVWVFDPPPRVFSFLVFVCKRWGGVENGKRCQEMVRSILNSVIVVDLLK